MLSEAKSAFGGKKILVSTQNDKCWVVILENNRLLDLFVEQESKKSILGNIYKPRRAEGVGEFVDIGIGRNVFLPDEENIEERLAGEVSLVGKIIKKMGEIFFPPSRQSRFGETVQVTRDADFNKAARVSRLITLSNRELVYLPLASTAVGVSHRIRNSESRLRLLRLARGFLVKNKIKGGFIVRTLARETSEKRLVTSARNLVELWKQTEWKAKRASAPCLVYQAPDYISRVVRDELDKGDILIADNLERYQKMKALCVEMVTGSERVYFQRGKTSLLKLHGVERQIHQLFQPRVELPSGGSLIVAETEAATTIDVNSGKLMGKKNPEKVALQTNLEACGEIARQTRLRGIGGIIVIDFINMKMREHCQKVETVLQEAFRDDRGRLKFTPISKLGLVELSRQRSRPSLAKLLGKACPHCKGRGLLFNTK